MSLSQRDSPRMAEPSEPMHNSFNKIFDKAEQEKRKRVQVLQEIVTDLAKLDRRLK